jgi:hypothetical protein
VSAKELQTKAEDVTMDEEVEQDTGMDTKILEAYEQPCTQWKRKIEKVSGAKKKSNAHRKQMETSLTVDDVELIATIVEDRL